MCVRAAVYTLCHSGGGFVQGLSPPPILQQLRTGSRSQEYTANRERERLFSSTQSYLYPLVGMRWYISTDMA